MYQYQLHRHRASEASTKGSNTSNLAVPRTKIRIHLFYFAAWSGQEIYTLEDQIHSYLSNIFSVCILLLKCDGARAETRFRLSAKRTSPFKSAGASVQSTTGSRGVRISGSNAGYTMFRGSVKSSGYLLHWSLFPLLPFPCVTV